MEEIKGLRVFAIIGLMLMMVLLAGSVLAADPVNLDLKMAIDKAIENNLDYQLATINYEKSKLTYQKQKANYLLQPSHYNELQNEISLNSAENTYQNTKYQLINDIISQYSNLWLSNLDLIIKEKNLALENLRLDESRAQYEIGDIGSVDLLDQENSYKDANYNLENAKDEYQQNVKEFMSALNIENGTLLLADLKFNGEWEINEDEAIKTALNNSVEIRLKEDQLELAQTDYERAAISAAELDKKIKEKSLQAARLEKEKAVQELKNSTQAAFYQYKQAVKKIEINQTSLKGAEEKYKLREKQYNAGLITNIEVLEYEANMLQAQYNYQSAVANYYQKEQALKQKMGLKSGVQANESSDKESE